MNYYKEIKDFLGKEPVDHMVIRQMSALEKACSQYYYVYSIYNKLSVSTRNVLKEYVDKEVYLTQENSKKKKQTSNHKQKYTISEKLYIEFFTKIYDNYCKKLVWSTVINYQDTIDDILNEYIDNDDNSTLKDNISRAANKYFTYNTKKINLCKVHKAFEELENALNTPKPTIEESVLAVISEDTLNNLLTRLKNGCSYRYINFYMCIAPICKALCDGTYHDYTTVKGNTQKYFNLKCQYELEKLNKYVFSDKEKDGIQGLLGLLNEYKSTKEELATITNH